jgi:hypothetical protein
MVLVMGAWLKPEQDESGFVQIDIILKTGVS